METRKLKRGFSASSFSEEKPSPKPPGPANRSMTGTSDFNDMDQT
jgi:hypothetical protein